MYSTYSGLVGSPLAYSASPYTANVYGGVPAYSAYSAYPAYTQGIYGGAYGGAYGGIPAVRYY